MASKSPRLRRLLVTGAVVAGAGLGSVGIASAATGSSGTSTTMAPSSSSDPASAPAGTTGDPGAMTHGPDEILLTGTDLASATDAANAVVPGATIVRAETNSSGASPYEVHMKKSDGTHVTVELDSAFKVVTTISGFGAGPAGSTVPISGQSSPSAAN